MASDNSVNDTSVYDNAQLVTLGEVKADGTPDISKIVHRFPVPARSMNISQKIRRDTAKVKGRSGSIKQATGYADATITIKLTLLDDESAFGIIDSSALDKLRQFQTIYRERNNPVSATGSSHGKSDVPRVYSIQSPQTDACGIKTVLIDKITPNFVGNGKSDINLTISMTEYEPTIRQREKQNSQEINGISDTLLGGGFSDPDGYSGFEPSGLKLYSEAHDEETGVEDPFAAGRRAAKAAAMGGEW